MSIIKVAEEIIKEKGPFDETKGAQEIYHPNIPDTLSNWKLRRLVPSPLSRTVFKFTHEYLPKALFLGSGVMFGSYVSVSLLKLFGVSIPLIEEQVSNVINNQTFFHGDR